MNIAEIKGLDDGVVIPDFSARVAFVNEHKGKVQTCKLEDETGQVKLVLILRDEVPMSVKGKQVTIKKALAQDNTFNGKTTREVKLLQRGSFEVQGSESPSAPSAPAVAGSNTKAASSNGNGNGKAHTQFYQGFLHDAVAIQVAAYTKGELDFSHFGSSEFYTLTLNITSDLVRVAQSVEEGKLAPSAKDPVVEKAVELFESDYEGEPVV